MMRGRITSFYGIYVTVVLAMWYFPFHTVQAGCPKFGIPVMEMCRGGHEVAASVLIDFYGASDVSETNCRCNVLVLHGNKLGFSQVSAPDYQGCGTEIQLQKDNAPQGGHIIRCYGGAIMPQLSAGDTVTIALLKHAPPMDTRYCYRLDIKGSSAPSMSISCDMIATPVYASTTPTFISTTAELSTENSTIGSEIMTDSALNDSVLGQSAQPTHCDNSDYVIGLIVLLTVVVVLFLYGAVVTVKLMTRKQPAQEEQSSYTDIYEEIPAKPYMSARPVYNESFNSHREASMKNSLHRECVSAVEQVRCELPPLATIQRSHWNWAYEEPNAPRMVRQNPHTVYQYENAAF